MSNQPVKEPVLTTLDKVKIILDTERINYHFCYGDDSDTLKVQVPNINDSGAFDATFFNLFIALGCEIILLATSDRGKTLTVMFSIPKK